ncbi:MAG: ABC transporter ATP-binding protein [Pseudomonadota bacterium]
MDQRIEDPSPQPSSAAARSVVGAAATAGDAPDLAVEVTGLVKTYKPSGKSPEKKALKGVDLAVKRGTIFGLLGPNGAGKSTLINILAGLVVKSAGEAKVWGHDIETAMRLSRSSIGVVPQELNMDPFFTPSELLDLQAGLYGVPKSERITDELLSAVGLTAQAKAYSRTLSGGMRRRLMVAKAMVHSPPVLVLDEPTAGVDVELRQSLWAHVRELNRAGTTILLTTHYLEEAEELCDEIAIINHGEVVACDTTENLVKQLDSKTLTVQLTEPIETIPAQLDGFLVELTNPSQIVVRYEPSQTRLGDVLNAMHEGGLKITDLSTEETDLEDIFLQITRS